MLMARLVPAALAGEDATWGALKPQILRAPRIMVKPPQIRSGSLVCHVSGFLGAQFGVDGENVISVGDNFLDGLSIILIGPL